MTLSDRLRPSTGARLTVRCLGDLRVSGRLERVGPDWLLVSEDTGREALVRTGSVLEIHGLVRLTGGADTAGVVASRLGLSSALRGLARDRSPVRIHLTDASALTGTIDRVGVDFVEVAVHPGAESRRRDHVRGVVAVAHAAIGVVRRDS